MRWSVRTGGCTLLWRLPEDCRRLARGRLTLLALGTDRARLALPGREVVLSARRSEVAVALALHLDGLGWEELAGALRRP